MNDQPRKHHYIPQFYLSGFTKTNSNNGELHVFDKLKRTSWVSSPKNAAHQRDFYAIEVDDNGDRMFVEKQLSHLEGKWSSVLRCIIEDESIPANESLDELMVFMAFMRSRIPLVRKNLDGFVDQISKSLVHQIISTPEKQNQFRENLEKQGHLFSDEEFNDLIAFGQESDLKFKIQQSFHIGNMFEGAFAVAQILGKRKWQIWKAKDEAPDLICSDNPVTLMRTNTDHDLVPPLLDSSDTGVIFPINRRIALVGNYEKEYPKYEMSENDVAVVNRMTLMNANQLYSSEKDFVWTTNEGSIGKLQDLEQALHNPTE